MRSAELRAQDSCTRTGVTASLPRQLGLPSQNSVLTVKSVQIFIFVFNNEEQKVYKNFKVIMSMPSFIELNFSRSE